MFLINQHSKKQNSCSTKMAAYENLSMYGKITYIFQWICFLIAVIGLLSNILSVIVLSRKNLQKHSFAFYIRMMNIFDMFVLITSFRHWAAFVLDQDLTVVSVFFCKISEYAVVASSSASSWHLFLINMDRLVTIVFPQRFLIFKDKRFQALLSFSAAAGNFLLYLPLSIYRDIQSSSSFDNQSNTTSLSKTCVVTDGKDLLVYMLNLVNTITVSFFLNNILTLVIIVFVFQSRKRFVTGFQNSSLAAKDRKFAINSIALNVASFFCKMPLLVVLVISAYLQMDGELVGMFFAIGVAIFTIDSSSAFFINYFVNTIFHKEFLRLFSFKKFGLNSKVLNSASFFESSVKRSNKC